MGRQHHYQFAHRWLPATPPDIWRGLLHEVPTGNADQFLLRIWYRVGSALPGDDRIDPVGLSASAHTIGDANVLLIAMPAPQSAPEAYFGAVILRDGDDPRYLTLELGFDPVQRVPYTVAGEWTADSHLNLGPGPEPTPQDFLAWLEPRVARRSS
jgi:hypothetical protein